MKATIRFVSPLFMGGADSKSLDPDGLRGPSLRGAWRFWFRALAAPMLRFDTEKLFKAEAFVFGKTDLATFRLRVQPSRPQRIADFNPRPRVIDKPQRKTQVREAYDMPVYELTITPRPAWNDSATQSALAATIWAWGHLGAVGLRARRGAGSFLLEDLQPLDHGLLIQSEFASKQELADYLRSNLTCAQALLHSFLAAKNLAPSPPWTATTRLRPETMFYLAKPYQVLLGDSLAPITDEGRGGAMNTIIDQAHAAKASDRSPRAIVFSQLMGDALGGHWPSPLFIRLTPLTDETLVPVMSWSPPGGSRTYRLRVPETLDNPMGLPVLKNFLSALSATAL